MAFIKMKETLWNQHKNCEVAVERNYQAKKLTGFNVRYKEYGYNPLQPALVCQRHRTWLKWLSSAEADQIEHMTQ